MFCRPFLLGVLFGVLIWGMLFWSGAVIAGVAGVRERTVLKESWLAVGTIVALLCAIGSIALLQPWNFFRPATGGKPMVPEGVWQPLDALREVRKRVAAKLASDPVKAAAVPKPFVIKRLSEIEICGLLEVTYGDGKVKHRLALEQLAWLVQFNDRSPHIILQQCGNDVRFAGNRRKGYYYITSVVDLSGCLSRELEVLPARESTLAAPTPTPEPEETT